MRSWPLRPPSLQRTKGAQSWQSLQQVRQELIEEQPLKLGVIIIGGHFELELLRGK